VAAQSAQPLDDEGSSQISRWPFSSTAGSTATLPSGSVASIASDPDRDADHRRLPLNGTAVSLAPSAARNAAQSGHHLAAADHRAAVVGGLDPASALFGDFARNAGVGAPRAKPLTTHEASLYPASIGLAHGLGVRPQRNRCGPARARRSGGVVWTGARSSRRNR